MNPESPTTDCGQYRLLVNHYSHKHRGAKRGIQRGAMQLAQPGPSHDQNAYPEDVGRREISWREGFGQGLVRPSVRHTHGTACEEDAVKHHHGPRIVMALTASPEHCESHQQH